MLSKCGGLAAGRDHAAVAHTVERGNNIFVLKSGDAAMGDIYTVSVAYSGDNPIAGQYAYVHIEPGETVCYRLGYIIDDRCSSAEGAYLYCIRDTGGQLSACYIPVAGH